ncbi:MAG TPA: hypothetical protein VIH36_08340 [Casimicrobiaceae bacterium]|jgi:hypothetical protein
MLPSDPSRRRFLAISGFSALLLAAGGAFAWRRDGASAAPLSADADARRIVRAIAPSMLGGALAAPADARTAGARREGDALDEVVGDALAGMDGLPSHARGELASLFALLAFAPARIVVAGLASRWETASRDDIDAVLGTWRDSRLELRRAAYDALHSLIMGAWYGNPRAWARIGYAGPPALG